MEVIFSFSGSTKAAGQGQGESFLEESVPCLLIENVSTDGALLPGPRTRARHAHVTTGRTQESTMPRTREVDAIEQAFYFPVSFLSSHEHGVPLFVVQAKEHH